MQMGTIKQSETRQQGEKEKLKRRRKIRKVGTECDKKRGEKEKCGIE